MRYLGLGLVVIGACAVPERPAPTSEPVPACVPFDVPGGVAMGGGWTGRGYLVLTGSPVAAGTDFSLTSIGSDGTIEWVAPVLTATGARGGFWSGLAVNGERAAAGHCAPATSCALPRRAHHHDRAAWAPSPSRAPAGRRPSSSLPSR